MFVYYTVLDYFSWRSCCVQLGGVVFSHEALKARLSGRGVTNSQKRGTDFKILNKFLKISHISKDFTKSNESCKI